MIVILYTLCSIWELKVTSYIKSIWSIVLKKRKYIRLHICRFWRRHPDIIAFCPKMFYFAVCKHVYVYLLIHLNGSTSCIDMFIFLTLWYGWNCHGCVCDDFMDKVELMFIWPVSILLTFSIDILYWSNIVGVN